MPLEVLIEKYERERKIIREAQERQAELIKQLSDEQSSYDWISVKKAAKIADISAPFVYRLIDTGKLEARHIGGRKFIKLSELAKLDDKYCADDK